MTHTPPKDAVIAVTHQCNAHCLMCNIWRRGGDDALRPDDLRKLPLGLRTVNLSGGEPFLRDDLPEFVDVVHRRCRGATITISTNAYLPERIERMMREIVQIDRTVRLAVSLDGLEATHDRVRGDEGAFRQAMECIERLRADGYHGLRLSMTLSAQNAEDLLAVADLADRLGLELGVVAAHGAPTHLGIDQTQLATMPTWLRDPFEALVARWLRSWRPKLWARAHFAAYTYGRLAGRPWQSACRAGRDFFFLQADGTVYSCSSHGRRMGNIREQDWQDIWNSAAGDGARSASRRCPERCWMICTARSVYRRRPVGVMLWTARSKLRAHLRLPCLPDIPQTPDQDSTVHANPAR